MFPETISQRMGKDDSAVTERILSLTLQIIYLLTGEDYSVVKKTSGECLASNSNHHVSGGWSRAWTHVIEPPPSSSISERKNEKMILKLIYTMVELLTGEVPIRCQDVAVYFSMEEWEYVEGHKDLYQDKMEDHSASPGDSSSVSADIHEPTFTKTCNGTKRLKDDASPRKKTRSVGLTSCNLRNLRKPEKPSPHILTEHAQQCPPPLVKKEPVTCEGSLKDPKMSMPADRTPQYLGLQIREEPVSCDVRSLKDPKMSMPADRTPQYLDLQIREEPVCDVRSLKDPKMFTPTDHTPQYLGLQIREEPVLCDVRSLKDPKMFTPIDHIPQYLDLQVKEEPVSCDERNLTDVGKNFTAPCRWRYPVQIKKEGPLNMATRSPHIVKDKVINGQMKNTVPLERNPESDLNVENQDQKFKTFICPKCNIDFPNKQLLVLHQRTHMREKPFLCSKCGKSFSKISHYIRHQSVHIGVKPYTCPDCGKSFSDRLYLSRHQRMHANLVSKPLKCPECDVRFMNQYELVAHCKIHTGKKPFECLDCGKRFTRNYQLLKHEKVHTGDVPFLCSECGTCFRNNALLVKHQQYHSKEKHFSCLECGKSFSDRSHFVRHVRIHTGEKPFMCSECGRRFNDKSSLSRHRRLHTGEKPYTCSDCSQAFRYSSSLLKHQEVHRISKPFKCPECDAYFMSNSELLTHCSVHSAWQ